MHILDVTNSRMKWSKSSCVIPIPVECFYIGSVYFNQQKPLEVKCISKFIHSSLFLGLVYTACYERTELII